MQRINKLFLLAIRLKNKLIRTDLQNLIDNSEFLSKFRMTTFLPSTNIGRVSLCLLKALSKELRYFN